MISTVAALASAGNVVRIDSIELPAPQPHATNPAVIWYDSFDRPSQQYWNKGSPKDQYRWYDDLVVSTAYIGPVHTPTNPVLIRTAGEGRWEAMIAVRAEGGAVTISTAADSGTGRDPRIGEDIQGEIVWRSKGIAGPKVTVDSEHGTFTGPRGTKHSLEPGKLHFCRSRAIGGPWSTWHQGFQTGGVSNHSKENAQ